jgi:glyoxylase-like metal-dependent hydrolase (beta-lactamase superfamily II)
MIFRQLFDRGSCTYSYLIADGGEACLIDPVLEHADRYIRLLNELRLSLVMAIDTHLHADHVTGLGALQARTRCLTVMSERTAAEVVSLRICDGDRVHIGALELHAIHTPGHTDDSCSFQLDGAVFTGDTLLIRGTGRTDFQNGDPAAQYDSLFNKLLRLPEDTRVYPGHDYNGCTVSTIGEERAHNPRLQVGSVAEYVDLMNCLKLPRPQMMDIAVPANLRLGIGAERTRTDSVLGVAAVR